MFYVFYLYLGSDTKKENTMLASKCVTVASESKLKLEAVEEFFLELGMHAVAKGVQINDDRFPEQPIGSTLKCAQMRMSIIDEVSSGLKVSIENGIEELEPDQYYDVCFVVIREDGRTAYGRSNAVSVPDEYFNKCLDATPSSYKISRSGSQITVGELIHADYPDIPANDWMSSPQFGGNPRKVQIKTALVRAWKALRDKTYLKQHVTLHHDFPKPGIVFKDLSKIIGDPVMLGDLISVIA